MGKFPTPKPEPTVQADSRKRPREEREEEGTVYVLQPTEKPAAAFTRHLELMIDALLKLEFSHAEEKVEQAKQRLDTALEQMEEREGEEDLENEAGAEQEEAVQATV